MVQGGTHVDEVTTAHAIAAGVVKAILTVLVAADGERGISALQGGLEATARGLCLSGKDVSDQEGNKAENKDLEAGHGDRCSVVLGGFCCQRSRVREKMDLRLLVREREEEHFSARGWEL